MSRDDKKSQISAHPKANCDLRWQRPGHIQQPSNKNNIDAQIADPRAPNHDPEPRPCDCLCETSETPIERGRFIAFVYRALWSVHAIRASP